jgi:ATP-dependent Lon protease
MPLHTTTAPGEFALDRFELPGSVKDRLKAEVEAARNAQPSGIDLLRAMRAKAGDDDPTSLSQLGKSKALPDAQTNWKQKPRTRGLVRVLDPGEVDRFADDVVARQSSIGDRNRANAIVRKIRISGAWKPPLKLGPRWREALAELEAAFPHFREVVDFLRANFALSELAGTSVAWTPIILDGEPGVGKTYFAEELASRLRVPSRRLDMSVSNTSAGLVGSDKAYDGSFVGLVFEMLAFGDTASPMIVLDELDKATGDDRFPATGALYGLLEPRTAASYRDQSVPEIALDSRHVLWLATSNDATRVPEPIRNRMRVFTIPKPSRDAAREIVLRMYSSMGRELMPGIELRDLEESVIRLLVPLAPRSVQLSLREAFGRAAFASRHTLSVLDFPVIKSAPRAPRFV